MTQAENIKEYCRRLDLSYIQQRLSSIILKAQEEQPTYIDFLADVLKIEAELREEYTRQVRVKSSRIPPKHDLDEYDFNFTSGISERQLKELKQLAWMEQAYNIILMGPSGTGKTYIAAGLIYEAIKKRKKRVYVHNARNYQLPQNKRYILCWDENIQSHKKRTNNRNR